MRANTKLSSLNVLFSVIISIVLSMYSIAMEGYKYYDD